jgi:hypothetical protein
MASLAEVFEIECDRKEPEKWNKIHLFKMGDFWRAYEWSAWLIAVITYNDNVRMATKDRKPIHVSKLARTDVEDTYCFVGFPVKSLEKYIPTRDNFESVDDAHVVVTISIPQPTDGSEVSYERLADALNAWKDGIEMSKKKEKKKTAAVTEQTLTPSSCGILSAIMAYPLSERTAMENMQFIQSLKKQISAIL